MPRTQVRKPRPLRRGGYYWVPNGDVIVPLLSVTDVLQEEAKQDFFVPAAIRRVHEAMSADPGMDVEAARATWYAGNKVKANLGSLMHSFYEAHQRGAPLVPDQLPDDVTRGHAKAFLNWFETVSPKLIQVEATVANFTYGYAGTGDLWAEIAGETSIVDYKTGFLNEHSCAMQESAYLRGEVIIDKATGQVIGDPPKVTAMYALQTRDDGTYQFVRLPDKFQDFLAYLHIRQSKKGGTCFAACPLHGEKKPDPAFITVCRECAAPQGSPHLSDCAFSVFRNFDGE